MRTLILERISNLQDNAEIIASVKHARQSFLAAFRNNAYFFRQEQADGTSGLFKYATEDIWSLGISVFRPGFVTRQHLEDVRDGAERTSSKAHGNGAAGSNGSSGQSTRRKAQSAQGASGPDPLRRTDGKASSKKRKVAQTGSSDSDDDYVSTHRTPTRTVAEAPQRELRPSKKARMDGLSDSESPKPHGRAGEEKRKASGMTNVDHEIGDSADESPMSKSAKITGDSANQSRQGRTDDAEQIVSEREEEAGVARALLTQASPGPDQQVADDEPPDAPDLRQRHRWAIDASMRKDAKFLPTIPPELFGSLNLTADGTWVADRCDTIRHNLINAGMVYCAENHKEIYTETDFCLDAKPELETLYGVLFGTDDWKWTVHNLKRVDPTRLTDHMVLTGLFGAGVFRAVFDRELPWDIEREVKEAVGDKMPYFETVINDLGHEMKNFWNYMGSNRVRDEKFRETEVKDYARKEAGALVLALDQHLKKLKPGVSEEFQQVRRTMPETMGGAWYDCLKRAFEIAIIVKLSLAHSRYRPFRYEWQKSGTKLVHQNHVLFFTVAAANEIAFSLVPAVVSTKRNGEINYMSRTMVHGMVNPEHVDPKD